MMQTQQKGVASPVILLQSQPKEQDATLQYDRAI